MKVLLVCTVPTEKSGIPNVIMNHLDSMKGSDIKFGYVSINDPSQAYKDILDCNDVELYIVPRQIRSAVSYVRQLAKIAKGYDVMHVHGNSATMVLEMIAAKAAGVPFRISHSHNTTCNHKLIDRMARPLFYKLCNGRIACGKEAGNWLFGNRPFLVLKNGINSARFKYDEKLRVEVRRSLGINEEKVIGHVGNFVEQKNHEFLINFFAEYLKRYNDTKLLLLGDGPLKEEIKSRVDSYGISDNVMFAGSVDTSRYINAMDVVVMPSLFEGLPLTLVEEQANGLNILCSDTITSDANLTGQVSFMSLSESLDKWVERVEVLLMDEPDRALLSTKAIEVIKTKGYDIEEVASELKQIYQDRSISY